MPLRSLQLVVDEIYVLPGVPNALVTLPVGNCVLKLQFASQQRQRNGKDTLDAVAAVHNIK